MFKELQKTFLFIVFEIRGYTKSTNLIGGKRFTELSHMGTEGDKGEGGIRD